MPLSLALSSLASRVTRTSATGATGIRRFSLSGSLGTLDTVDEVDNFWDGLKRFAGSLLSNITWQPPWLKFSVSSLFSSVVSTVRTLLNFNWNSTDTELDAKIKSAEIAVASAEGAARGSFIGYLICGILPTAAIAVFNEPLALYTLKNVGEEAAEEIAANVSTLILLQQQKNVQQAFYGIFKNYRSVLRPAAIGFARILERAGVLDKESVDQANKQKNKPWSIHNALEESIDRIEDPVQRARTEEFWDEFGEACIEAGYIVAGSIDSYFLQQKIADEAASGTSHTVVMSTSGAIGTTIPTTPSTS